MTPVPRNPLRSRRSRVALAALAAAAVAAAGCSSSDPGPDAERQKQERPEKREIPPAGEQPVRDPRAGDHFSLGDPLPTPERPRTPEQPNLLMITVDDATRADFEHMPLTQELVADQGITLTDGLAPTPICVPARASLITGQYAHNHGALTISGEGGGYDAFVDASDDDTLPVWLSDSGYDTMFIGKYLNGYTEKVADTVPPGWTDWQATVDFSTYNFTHPTVSHNGDTEEHEQYSTDLFRDQTVELLEDDDRAQDPWYLWVNYVAPHVGGPHEDDDPPEGETTTPAEEDRDKFADLELPDKPNMFEDTRDKYLADNVGQHWTAKEKGYLTEAYQQRIESLQSVDRAVADTVRTLEETGQLDDTYIVITSDNGYAMGEHNLAGKLWYFDEMANIPMLVRGPGLPKGVTSSTPVTNADWAPTFAALAGVEPTREVDGVDVLPWLTADAPRRVIPIEAYPVKGGRRPLYTGVIIGNWTYAKGRRKYPEMYNRALDPYENSNLARDPRFQRDQVALGELRRQVFDCSGAECPTDFYR